MREREGRLAGCVMDWLGGVGDGVCGMGLWDAFPLSRPFLPLPPFSSTLAVVSLVGRGREVGGGDGPGKGVWGCGGNDVVYLRE